jgi:TonB family protein
MDKMKRVVFGLLFIGGFLRLHAQETVSGQSEKDSIYFIVDENPGFKSGDVNAWLAHNIIYPQSAITRGIEGKVFVSFVIEKDGTISNVSLLRGVDTSLNREALRVVSGMPKWTAGKLKNKLVRVKLVLPLSFKLMDLETFNKLNKVYCDTCVQTPPRFSRDMLEYFRENVARSEVALENHAQGNVDVSFIIEKDGSMSNIKVERSDPGASLLEHDALRFVKGMTDYDKWTPGYNDGHPVRVRKFVTIRYNMGSDQELYKVYKYDK